MCTSRKPRTREPGKTAGLINSGRRLVVPREMRVNAHGVALARGPTVFVSACLPRYGRLKAGQDQG